MGGFYPVDSPEEAQRYFNEGSVTRQLIDKIKYDIYDFESFKELLKQAFSEDLSLSNLLEANGWGDDSYRALFENPLIQKWVEANDHNKTISYLAKQSNISQEQARRLFEGMNQVDRNRVRVASTQQRKITIQKRLWTREERKVKRIPKIEQVSKSGTTYRRTKPQKWTGLQDRFLQNNRGLRVERILELYNLLFPLHPRTVSSLRNKLYRTRS